MKRRARSGAAAAGAIGSNPVLVEQLIDLRDQLAEARSLTAAAWLASGSPTLSREIAGALSALTNVARERLEDVLAAIDVLIASIRAGDS